MSKLYFIINVILFGTIYRRQIGLIANHIVIYQPPTNNSSIIEITLEKTSSCNTCICAASMSQIDYVAINCYKDNNTCSLFTQLVNFTAIIPCQNSFLYILPYISMPLTPGDDPMSSSSVSTITLTSTASFIITTTSSMTAISASVDTITGISTASTASVSILTITAKTTTTTTMLTVATTTSIITTTTMPTVATTTIRITTTTTMPTVATTTIRITTTTTMLTVATTTSRITTTTAYRTTTTTTQGGSGSCAFLIFFCS